MPTPSHKYNKWADDRKKIGNTPATASKKDGNVSDDDYDYDQKRLDREWYGMDENEGFDEENNSFAAMSEAFLDEKREHIKQKWKRKVSFHQQQKNRVGCLLLLFSPYMYSFQQGHFICNAHRK